MPHIFLEPNVVAELPLSAIDFDPDQPRTDVDDAYIADLAADISLSGVKQPITVRPNPETKGRYIIKYGECRYRASQLVMKKTIPALLDTEEASQSDPLTRMLDQVKENHLRKDLNAMEWSCVLRRMRDDHKVKKIADIETTLKEHGIVNMGRSYISNIIRLAELPDWAQDLIRCGSLTAAHGKYMLQATASEPVLEAVRTAIEKKETQDTTTRELQSIVYRAYNEAHDNLNTYSTQFDVKTACDKCQKKRAISDGLMRSGTFCLDHACYQEKNKAAKEAAAARREEEPPAPRAPETIEVAEDDTVDVDENQLEFFTDYRELVDARFDAETECAGCKHRHIPTGEGEADLEECCFNIACYQEKEDAVAAVRERQRALKDLLTDHLRQRLIVSVLPSNETLQLNLISFMAIGAPEELRTYADGDSNIILSALSYQYEEGMDEICKTINVFDLESALQRGVGGFALEIAAFIVKSLSSKQTIATAHHAGMSLDDYRIDDKYLDIKTDEELRAMLEALDDFRAPTQARMAEGAEALRALCLEHAETIGVPEDLRTLYEDVSQETATANAATA